MAQKFFLFKRKDPAVSGGALFSDNGKGISVISFPASNLAYMVALKGSINMYFNNSAPFEENSLKQDGESFEKSSISVTCNAGEESDLMEDIINFINRETSTSVMRFDATGVKNTFGLKTATPGIDVKVRARPVERGLTGTEATVTGLDSAAVINGIDFISTDNLPFADYEAEDTPTITPGKLTVGNSASYDIPNGAPGASEAAFVAVHSTDYPPLLRGADSLCSKKTLDYNVPGRLKIGVITSPTLSSSTMAETAAVVEGNVGNGGIERDSAVLSTDILSTSDYPKFQVTTDSGGNVTELEVTYSSRNLQEGDEITITTSNGNVTLTLKKSDFPTEIPESLATFISSVQSLTLVSPSYPLYDYTVFCVFVRPNGAFLDPFYASMFSASLTSTFRECMGPFPYRSLGDAFEFNHNRPEIPTVYPTTPNKIRNVSKAEVPFSSFIKKDTKAESSKENLNSIVIRRTKTGDIHVYNGLGEQIAFQSSKVDPDGVFTPGKFGMVLPCVYGEPTTRIARFGAISKDIGDTACRDLGTQLLNRFKVSGS
tara:strand:- start:1531 stop:3162 length:1632 start_codon:yes stop_codon:yes gene_type:complete